MATTEEIIRVIGAVEAFLPIVAGLVRDLRNLIAGSAGKSVEQILTEADANWNAVIADAKRELGSTA